MDASADLELGDSDMLLLIDTDTEQWYLAYGGDMADYVDNDLSILFRQNLGSLFTGSCGKERDGALSGPGSAGMRKTFRQRAAMPSSRNRRMYRKKKAV